MHALFRDQCMLRYDTNFAASRSGLSQARALLATRSALQAATAYLMSGDEH